MPIPTTRSTTGATRGSIPSSANSISRDALAHIRVPILIVQGENDQYGTARQIDVAQRGVLLPGRGRVACQMRAMRRTGEAPETTLRAMAEFCNRLLRDHREGVVACAAADATVVRTS